MIGVASLVAALALTAPWPDGGTIPERYTCDGADVAPRLAWVAVTAGARPVKAVAIEMLDLDAPGGVFVHWLQVGRVHGRNTFGKLGYSGPCPPAGDPPHRYVVRTYFLDARPRLRTGFTDAQLHRAIRGHVTGRAAVTGRYGR